jgi:predicted AAA+ superfamily ATPase
VQLSHEIVPRFLERSVRARLAEEPVIVLNGPRTVGKSTLLRSLAETSNREVMDLDDLATRDAVAADPEIFAAAPSPVLIDEFQHVPELLDAIKAELNRDLRPGRFVLTGSTRYFTLPRAAQALTGRVHIMPVHPLSQGEIEGRREDFLDVLLDDPAGLANSSPPGLSREAYASRVLAGGFPLALRRAPGASRARWFRDYVTLVIERDVLDIRRVRQREILPRLLRSLAAQTGQILNVSRVARHLGIDPTIAEDYTRLLEAVFLVHRLPAWGRTLRSRVAAQPKLHVFDTGAGAHLSGLTADRLATRDPAALSEYGHFVESFVVNELLKQVGWSDRLVQFGHFRTHDGDEVDVVIEHEDGRVSAVEVKASSRVRDDDLKGLRILDGKLGNRFVGGAVVYLGPHAYRIDDRIHVLPLSRLWS